MRGGAPGGPLAVALERVREGLGPVGALLEAEGMPVPDWSGKLIRPLVGYAAADEEQRSGEPLWLALAAVQLAHEASLLHDDVIDGAAERRAAPTVAATRGVASALVEGDHLLTAAYRLAARTGSLAWAELFARAVERTVAGEKAQARSAGTALEWSSYEELVLGKSGELLGAALAAGPALRGDPRAEDFYELGRRVGLVYQMLDDLLDYCPHARTGKPALGDHTRGLWTWPLIHVDVPRGIAPAAVWGRFLTPGSDGVTPAERCLAQLSVEATVVSRQASERVPGDTLIRELVSGWVAAAEEAVGTRPEVELPPVAGWEQLMEEHAKSFRFAARLFPAERREQVVGVYAWCRYTDDLVDGVDLPPAELEARLDAWLDLSRRAYDGERTGNPLADRVMAEMRTAGVPFGYAAELVEGMRMDIRGVEYHTLSELWTYTFRVASVVGLWLTELFGIRDPWLLDRAASLGHAMQLTNILRDVGEDLDDGRVYLPGSWLTAHGVTRADLERMRRTGQVDPGYRHLIQRLVAVAEAEYRHAAPAIARLPGFFRRPVAVAADVYRGIHDAIRDNGYDNLTRRAYTGPGTKLRLGALALWRYRPAGAARWSDAAERKRRTSLLARLAPAVAVAAPLALAGAGMAGAALVAPATVAAQDLTRAARVEPLLGAGRPAGPLDAIGSLWLLAVDEESAIDAGLAAIASLRDHAEAIAPPGARLLRAYEGAFIALRAKHGGWPPERLRNLKDGFARMDAVVAEAPDAAGPRYIRLMSGFYLPGVFGRGDEVEADLAALAELLPGARPTFPAALYPEVVDFVLRHATLTPAQRLRLQAVRP